MIKLILVRLQNRKSGGDLSGVWVIEEQFYPG
jgi:hypothetical protein